MSRREIIRLLPVRLIMAVVLFADSALVSALASLYPHLLLLWALLFLVVVVGAAVALAALFAWTQRRWGWP